jgi:adenylate cyclase
MAKEIERKFLVKGSFLELAVKEIKITQAYLSVDSLRTIRVRISDDKAFLTIKSQENMIWYERNEWEVELKLSDAKEILEICLPGKIEKSRYMVPFGNHIFEVDVFHGDNEGLVIAEIELSNGNEWFEKPDWLGEEVTGRPEYYNSNLI